MIAAILRAQFLSLRPRARTRKGGAVVSVITGAIFYGFWAFLSFGVMLYFSQPDSQYFTAALSSGLLLIMLYWQLAPIISASYGASLDLRKLLGYPIPHSQLYVIEVLLLASRPAPRCFCRSPASLPVCCANPLYGARSALLIRIRNPRPLASFNVLTAAGGRHLLERPLLRTRLKEVFFLIFVFTAKAAAADRGFSHPRRNPRPPCSFADLLAVGSGRTSRASRPNHSGRTDRPGLAVPGLALQPQSVRAFSPV